MGFEPTIPGHTGPTLLPTELREIPVFETASRVFLWSPNVLTPHLTNRHAGACACFVFSKVRLWQMKGFNDLDDAYI